MRYFYFLVVSFCWCVPTGTDAASMDIHSVVARRAIDYFGNVPKHAKLSALIRASPNAILGGADFPDFLYACGKYADHHDAGEVAHWPRFLSATAFLRARGRGTHLYVGCVGYWMRGCAL